MAYQVIYRKWRPLVFEDVVGQNHITDTLKTELITKKVAHAYLFCGTRGTGKTTTAKILSRGVNCERLTPNGNPCNECPSCTGILHGTIMDVIEIDAASNNGVENIRDLRDEIIYTPANVKHKVYIIDEVHMLSTGAFNALLKTLEEPPAHAIFILATTEPHKIPATIQSRCQRFDFRRIKSKDIAGRIGEIARKDNISIEQDAINLIATLGNGSMRDALSILDLCISIEGNITKADIENLVGVPNSKVLFDTCAAIINSDISSALLCINNASGAGRDILNLAEELLGFFREILICKLTKSPSDILDKSDEEIGKMTNLASQTSDETIIHAISVLSEAVATCRWASNQKVILEAALVKICRPELDSSSEAFAARIKKLEAALKLGGFSSNTAKEPLRLPKQTETKNVRKTSKEESNIPPFPELPPPEDEFPKPAPFSLEKAKEPTIQTETEQKPTEEKALPLGQEFDSGKWADIVAALKVQDPSSGALLEKTSVQIKNDNFYVIFEIDSLKDVAEKDTVLTDLIKKAVGNYDIRYVTKEEFGKKKFNQKDPLDELIAKKADLGEQMTIF